MLHLIHALDEYIVLDVGSGAVHAIDEMTYQVLSHLNKGLTREDVISALLSQYPQNALDEVIDEVALLEEMGQLNAPHSYQDVDIHSPGVIKAMCLHVAHDCNLRCKYCFAGEGDYHAAEKSLLSLEVGKAALDWLVEKSGKRVHLEVDFFGGEPLLNFPVMKALVEYGRELEKIHNKKIKFTTTTNCVALTDEIIDFLNQEMGNIVLSIDGRPQVHDKMRPTANQKGSYSLIVPKAKQLIEQRGDKEYYVRGTFTHYNLDFSEDVLHLADAGFDQLSIEPVVSDPSLPYAITEDDLPQIEKEYDRLAKAYYSRRKEGKWFNFFHFMLDLSSGPCLRKRLTGCGAGNEYIAITPQGDIYPCHQFVGREGYQMGNVLQAEDFDKKIQNTFSQNHVLNKPTCQNCWAKFFCSGGCAANAEAYSGNLYTPYNLECEMERKRLEYALALAVKEQKDKDKETI